MYKFNSIMSAIITTYTENKINGNGQLEIKV